MATKNSEAWCSDTLHDLLGYSDGNLAGYLVHVARNATSFEGIVKVLEDGGQSGSEGKTEQFAKDLYLICQKERGHNEEMKEHQDEGASISMKKMAQPRKKEGNISSENLEITTSKRKRNRRKSASSCDEGSDEGEVAIHKKRRSAEKRREERRGINTDKDYDKKNGIAAADNDNKQSLLTEEERAELERENDLQDRDEFIKRMLKRDESKTKKTTATERDEEDKAHQNRPGTEERLARGEAVIDEATGKAITLEQLRDESRRFYLKKREERELALLKQSLQDEELFFKDVNLTEAEEKRIALGKRILSMAEERDGKYNQQDGFYRLPDEYDDKESKSKQDQAKLTSRYQEEKQEKTEQQLWEESQTTKATIFRKKGKNANGEYDFVFNEQIDFVMHGTQKGYDGRDKKRKAATSRIKTEEELRTAHPMEPRPVTEHEKIQAGRQKLPVFPYRNEFLAAVKEHQVLILVGETGSGKTTQIPQYLHEVGYSELGKIGCTQPRRVAAMSVAARVAQEMDTRLGHEVGYSIRFENCTSPKTIIQYMTDGMLLREILTQPDLASYSCMVIDEAHERTLSTDILFTLLKDIVRFRNDLKLIVSSATLDAEKFSKFFDDASIFMIPGRMFPVDIYYTKSPEADYVDAAVVTVLQIHVSQPLDGDVLVFLTGQEEIETASEVLTQRTRNLGSRIKELIICPIYANLPSEQQTKIFEKTPKGARKVVLATNIAETSLTIDGIKYDKNSSFPCVPAPAVGNLPSFSQRPVNLFLSNRYVIDTGFNKQKSFNAKYGMESLVVTPISQAAANQRAGRAGRTQPGKVSFPV